MAKLEPVSVYLRLRPHSETESQPKKSTVEVLSDKEIQLRHQYPKRFGFNWVFTPKSSQAVVYNRVAAPLVDKVLNGYTCTLLAYGHSGTGKSHTLFGDATADCNEDSDAGCIPRTLKSILGEMRKLKDNVERTVRVSYVELFNEEFVDLLHDNSEPAQPLRVQEDPEQKGNMYIQNLTALTICDSSDVRKVFEAAKENRHNSSALENADGRSHKIFLVNVYTRTVSLPGDEQMKSGKMLFVGVAGCENLKKSGKRDRKGHMVNQSLITLTNVVKALEERANYVPHNESKLTKILRESFGGRAKTAIICTISPSTSEIEDTLNALSFARGAKTIKNALEMNKITTKSHIVNCLNAEMNRLEKDLLALRSETGFYVNAENYNGIIKDTTVKEEELKKKVKQIEEMEEKIEDLKMTKKVREKEWELLSDSFELTKNRALIYKKRLLEKQAKVQSLKAAVEVTEQASSDALKQKEELSMLLQECTSHFEILEGKTQSALEKIAHNHALSKDLCTVLANTFSNLVRTVKEGGEEFVQNVTGLASGIASGVEAQHETSRANQEKATAVLAELQNALKPDGTNRLKAELERTVGLYNAGKRGCIDALTAERDHLKNRRNDLARMLRTDAEAQGRFNTEQLKAAELLGAFNKELLIVHGENGGALGESLGVLEASQREVAGLDGAERGSRRVGEIEKRLREVKGLHEEEKSEGVKMRGLMEKAKAFAEMVARVDVEARVDLAEDVDGCCGMVREVAPVSVFEDEFGASTVNGNVEEFLLEKVAALGRSDEKAAISAVVTEQLRKYCDSDASNHAGLKQALSADMEELFELLAEERDNHNVMHSTVVDTFHPLVKNIEQLLASEFGVDSGLNGVQNNVSRPHVEDLLCEDGRFSRKIGDLVERLQRLQGRLN